MIRSMEGFTFASALDLKIWAIITSNLMLMLKSYMYHCIPMGKIQIQTLTHGYQDRPGF
jgi:hypothetical protein